MPAHLALPCKCLRILPAVPHVCVSPTLLHASSAPLQPQIIFVGVYLLTKSGSQKPKPAEYDKVDDAAQQVCAQFMVEPWHLTVCMTGNHLAGAPSWWAHCGRALVGRFCGAGDEQVGILGSTAWLLHYGKAMFCGQHHSCNLLKACALKRLLLHVTASLPAVSASPVHVCVCTGAEQRCN